MLRKEPQKHRLHMVLHAFTTKFGRWLRNIAWHSISFQPCCQKCTARMKWDTLAMMADIHRETQRRCSKVQKALGPGRGALRTHFSFVAGLGAKPNMQGEQWQTSGALQWLCKVMVHGETLQPVKDYKCLIYALVGGGWQFSPQSAYRHERGDRTQVVWSRDITSEKKNGVPLW